MEALILSCGTGGGHDSAARAVMQELQIRGHRATLLNPYTLHSEKLARRINNSYISMAQKTPHLFGAVYMAGQLYRKLPCRSPVYFINRGMVSIMQRCLSERPYDVIIMTHLYPAEIITNMKYHGIAIPKTIFVATDYVCTPFVEETLCDAYIAPAADLVPDYVRRGIPEEKLYAFGIPTGRAFANPRSKEDARLRLNLDPRKKYILITGGSMGGGTIRETISCLMDGISGHPDIGLIVVCGSNQALYDRLTAAQPENAVIVGYTDDMAGYMRAADLFITKPGGLSSTEAAVCGIPILHTGAIPGCELYNADYFSAHGMSAACCDPGRIPSLAIEILSDPQRQADMAACQRRLIDGSACANICRLAETMVSGQQA